MSAVLTASQLRVRIDTLERLHSVMTAIDEVSSAELGDDETLKLGIGDDGAAIAYVHDLPPSLVLVGLRAIQRELEAQEQQR